MRAVATSMLLLAASAQAAQITSLPGVDMGALPFRMWGGYVNFTSPVQQATTVYTYHWVVESETAPSTAPLILWMQGGPGCSGLFGAGYENGPFTATGNPFTPLSLNPLRWNRFANMLYIEQPAGVGFSYSVPADYQNFDDTISAANNYAFLQAFFAAHPEWQNNPLYIVGESYGGAYIPQLFYQILTGPDTRLAAQFAGAAIGNPVINCPDPFINIAGMVQADLFYWHGNLPLPFYQQYVAANCSTLYPPAACNDLTNQMFTLVGADLNPDNLYGNPCGNATLGVETDLDSCVNVDGGWDAYLNRSDVQAAIFAQPPAMGSWSDCANIGYNLTWPNSLPQYAAAFAAGKKILIFSGDVDIATCPFAGTQYCIEKMNRNLVTPWAEWKVLGQAAGYVEVFDTFTYATVKGAGHEVPGFQPLAAYQMVQSFISTGQISSSDAALPEEVKAGAAVKPAAKRSQGNILREAMKQRVNA